MPTRTDSQRVDSFIDATGSRQSLETFRVWVSLQTLPGLGSFPETCLGLVDRQLQLLMTSVLGPAVLVITGHASVRIRRPASKPSLATISVDGKRRLHLPTKWHVGGRAD